MHTTRRNLAGQMVLWGAAATIPASIPKYATAQTRASGMYEIRDVTFPSGQETLAGKLFMPTGEGLHPAVTIMGPVAFVKEQSPIQYATRLVQQGLAVLIFDPRNHGASTGEPRRFESGEAKIEDLRAAVDFLREQDGIDPSQLHLLGICQGVNWAIEAAAQDERIASLGIVAGHYLTPDTAIMYLGEAASVEARMNRSAAAAAKFSETGTVDYIPIVGSPEALLTATAVAEWYLPWDNEAPWFLHRGGWENRITAMSEAGIWGWQISDAASRLTLPVLMVHGDKAASGPDIPKRIYQQIPSAHKALHWIDGANQLQFYEDPLTIDRVVAALGPYFRGEQINL